MKLGAFYIMRSQQYWLLVVSILIVSCKKPSQTLFELLPAGETGINFNNVITESDSFNILTEEYLYNGGGVAVADFNNDGLQDIFFTGNQVPNELYLNKGNLKFENISEKSGIKITDGRWNSGAVVVDINNDGWKDIYVTTTMSPDSSLRKNMLFLNKGLKDNVPVFEEVAEQYGIADSGYSTMAAFFDYDLDGDLDLYVLTNQHLRKSPSDYRIKIVDGSSPNNDRLYRNNGNDTFTNVTKEAGIVYEGYGLGLAMADFNADGWPDIYVSNDFLSNDILYINNGNGTFRNESPTKIAHQSHSSMGNDAADFNNDGLTDIVTLDMLPETNSRKKSTINNKSYLNNINNERYGYEYQYVRNMLHVNNGLNKGIKFSEIGQLAGIHQTEWSWAPLFADFDNDGYKDLLVTNGFPKDITDKDFSNYRNDVERFVKISNLIDSIPVIKISNYAFKNNGDLTFTDISKVWGFTQPSFSNGAAFADLDNDGDLDYIVNNINDKAFIYKNTLTDRSGSDTTHYMRIKLVGPSPNKQALGTKVTLYYNKGLMQSFEHYVARGYLSSVEDIIHVGLGDATIVDSISIVWPNGNLQQLRNIRANQVLTITYDSQSRKATLNDVADAGYFSDVSKQLNLRYKHQEDDRIDFNIQRTLPHKFSQSGPGISIGDVNGDGLEDVLIGGSFGYVTSAFIQKMDGTFVKSEVPKNSFSASEDEGMLLFDADNDNDLDLYVVSGSIEHEPGSVYYQDRLYRNDGKGKFTLDTKAIPDGRVSGSCVRAADFDRDNDLDLFVGGRVVPGSYPYPAKSILLRNDNGSFTDVTATLSPELENVGMVTDALFTDYDNDGKPDLIVVGEFMAVTVFKNEASGFKRITGTGLETLTGWWNSIVGGDFDNDGDTDYIVGNHGTNNTYQVHRNLPLKIIAKDFDGNGSVDAILGCYIKESLTSDVRKLYPVHFWDEINSQSPRFRKQFTRYSQYGKTTLDKLFKPEELKDALVLDGNYFSSSYIENTGNGKFKVSPLPLPAQTSPVNGLVTGDINEDGNLDVMLIGNDYGNEVFSGRYDALTGVVLMGDGKGNFSVSSSAKSGFYVPGDAKALARLSTANSDYFIATQNIDSIKVYKHSVARASSLYTPERSDSYAAVTLANGAKHKVEFYYGSGYLSQSSRAWRIPKGTVEFTVYDFKGNSRVVKDVNLNAGL